MLWIKSWEQIRVRHTNLLLIFVDVIDGQIFVSIVRKDRDKF